MPEVPDSVLIYCKQSDCSFSVGGDIQIIVVGHQARVSPDVAMRVTREFDQMFSDQPFPAEQQIATENVELSPEEAAVQLAKASIQLETPYEPPAFREPDRASPDQETESTATDTDTNPEAGGTV